MKACKTIVLIMLILTAVIGACSANDAYKNNPLEAAKYTNVRKMMEAHLANSFKEAKKSKPVEKEDNGISEVDKEWLNDLKEQRNFNAFFENLKSN